MKVLYYMIVATAIALTGCSTAGPFVTNLSSDGGGGITVEKCMVHMNAFLGVVSNSDCTNTSIRLSQPTPVAK